MDNFQKWDREFRSKNLSAFNNNENGLLWLKVKAISRTKIMEDFIKSNDLPVVSTKIAEQSVELFNFLECFPNSMLLLDLYLIGRNREWYKQMGVDEERLKEDLYKVTQYTWGGDQNNSLDRYLVSKFVKSNPDYDILCSKQPEIAENAWNYVQNSWYNNWTSYLIESVFKHHQRVVSAIGEINPTLQKKFFFTDFYLDFVLF